MKSPSGLVSVEMKFLLGSWDYVSSLECSKMIPNHYMKHVSPFLSSKKKNGFLFPTLTLQSRNEVVRAGLKHNDNIWV